MLKILTVIITLILAVSFVVNYSKEELFQVGDEVLRSAVSRERLEAEKRTRDNATATQKPPPGNQAPVPPGFRGPTGDPSTNGSSGGQRIIGPGGNPPNY